MLSVTQIANIITSGLSLEDEEGVTEAAQKIYDLCKPDHDLHVMAAVLENEVTSTLLDMAVATTLVTLIEEQGHGRSNLTISPMSMEHMHQHYTYTSEIDGLQRTIRVAMREDSPLKDIDEWRKPSNRHGLTDVAPPAAPGDDTELQPQAEPHEYNRPQWVVACNDGNGGTVFYRCLDRRDAERELRSWEGNAVLQSNAHIENRWCLHTDCPSTGCNHDVSLRDARLIDTEVSSESD